MRQSGLLAALLLCLAAQPAVARDINDNYATFGVGGESCALYLEARAAGDGYERSFQEWIAGHLTAYNLLLENTYDIMGDTSPYELMGMLDLTCEQNLDLPVVRALALQIEQLYADRQNLSPNRDSGWKNWLDEIRQGTAEKMNPEK